MSATLDLPAARTVAGQRRWSGAPAVASAAERELPAWPVLAVLWGYPLWWAFGMLAFAGPVMALVMLAFLILKRRVSLVPGVASWLAFVIWMIPTAVMVSGVGRMIGLGMRFAQFFAVAVMIVYIVNARRSLTPRHILNALTFVWVFIIIGGYLGMLWPEGRLALTIGNFIPSALVENDYVSELVFPGFAEIQTPYGSDESFMRPSAPFAYANGWGAAMAILTPIVIATAISHRTARSTWLLAFGVVAAIPPAVATTNRGLFVGIGLGIAYVLFRLLLRGRWQSFLGMGLLSAAVAVMLALSGLLDGISERQEAVDTTDGRMQLYVETFVRSLGSPVLGHGVPLPSHSSEIYVGTQGTVWNLMFCYGFVGLGLFAIFLVGGMIRTADAPNLATLWLHASVVVAVGLSLFYGLDRQMLFVGAVMALMLREKYVSGSQYWKADPVPFWKLRRAR